jgi:hypothetical protein
MMTSKVGALLHWGIGQDAGGYYVCVRLDWDDGRTGTFTAEARFRHIEEAEAFMKELAVDKAVVSRLLELSAMGEGWMN